MPSVPAPGFRGNTSGGLSLVGNDGYSWACTPVTGDHYRGMYLYFHVTGLHPSSMTGRAYGLQLRCLSE